MKRILVALAGLLLAVAPARTADVAATLSFAVGQQASSYPATLSADGESIRADLSALPRGTAVYRAVLHVERDPNAANGQRNLAVKVTEAGKDEPLPLLSPRCTAFDVTAAVSQAMWAGTGKAAFTVVSLPGYQPAHTRLDVTCAASAKRPIPHVKELRARHRAGQTLLTWREVEPPVTAGELTAREWREVNARLEKDPKQIRYRIYRGSEPIKAANLDRVEFVDEIGPLSGWDADYYGIAPRDEDRLFRFVVEDGKEPVPPCTGIYAHNPRRAGKAYYAVSVALNGEEDLSSFGEGNALALPVEERVGQGVPVLQRTETPRSFNYVDGPTLHYFTRWEAPPNCNLPSRPYDYLVALPARAREPLPVGLHLHCWGGNLNSGYGWWYDAAQGAMLLSTNQVPYDWWTGYHEALGTGKSWSGGMVRAYTQTRILSFLDWTATRWKIDRNRVFSAGSSMGGSGSPNLGIRHADRIGWVVSWVGVHSPARSPQFKASYEQVYGRLDWKFSYEDGKTSAFDYFDDVLYLRSDPARATPLVCFANGKNDVGIGWPQAQAYWKTLQETHRPHVFIWGQAGHGQRALLPGPRTSEREMGIDVRLDQTLPAFTHCSLDDDPGKGDPKDGAAEGQSNAYLYWVPDTAVDQAGEWAMDLRLNAQAPKRQCTVDVTPRRCQKFRPKQGTKVFWSNRTLPGGKEAQSGEVVVDEWGLVTVPGVQVGQGANRLQLRLAR